MSCHCSSLSDRPSARVRRKSLGDADRAGGAHAARRLSHDVAFLGLQRFGGHDLPPTDVVGDQPMLRGLHLAVDHLRRDAPQTIVQRCRLHFPLVEGGFLLGQVGNGERDACSAVDFPAGSDVPAIDPGQRLAFLIVELRPPCLAQLRHGELFLFLAPRLGSQLRLLGRVGDVEPPRRVLHLVLALGEGADHRLADAADFPFLAALAVDDEAHLLKIASVDRVEQRRVILAVALEPSELPGKNTAVGPVASR